MAVYTHNEIANSPTVAWIEITAAITSITATEVILTNSDGTLTVLSGSGFAGTVGGSLTAGSITAADRRDAANTVTYETITDFAYAATDFSAALASNGLQGVAAGILAGDDTLNGFSGADFFKGFTGNDTFNGGGGLDTARYSGPFHSGAIAVLLSDTSTVTSGPSDGIDTLNNVEQVIGSNSNAGDDFVATASFVGSFGSFNMFEGRGGNDRITGNGNTRLSYNEATAGVTVNLIAGTASGDGSVGVDTFTGVNSVLGSQSADSITGDANANVLIGQGGNDTINGGGGADTIVYFGNRASYAITYNAPSQTFTIVDQRAGSPDGTDSVANVAGGSFEFADGTITAAALISAVNRAPVITSAPVVADVVEDGTSSASGLFTAVDPDGNAPLLWSVVGATITGANYQFTMDSLLVTKNGAQVVFDDFADDIAPPSAAPGFPNNTYAVNGAFTETGGRLVLDSATAVPLTAPGTPDPFTGQVATLRTNIDPANLTQGLKSNSSFSVEGRFDLSSLPDTTREAFGIRLSDRLQGGSGTPPDQLGDDNVELVVIGATGGGVVVRLLERNFVTDQTIALQSIALAPPAGSVQILLRLSHDVANAGVVQASFDYLDAAGAVVGTQTFSAVGHIFGSDTAITTDDENWTRAQVFAFAPQQGDSILTGTYGTLAVSQGGDWEYMLANAQANVQALAQGEQVTDTFQVRVTDGSGSPSGTTLQPVVVNVTGTNDTPTDISLANASVAENSAAGTVVGTLGAADVDNNDTASFSLLDGAGGRFAINGNQLVVLDATGLDFEQAQSHSVTVRVTDAAGATFEEAFSIAVTDVSPEAVTGGAGNDTIVTGDDSDNVTAGAGDDLVQTGAGDDTVTAGDGNDVVQTGAGDDTIVGGTGNGDDVYDAGADSDTVVYASAVNGVSVDLRAIDRSSEAALNGGTIGTLLVAAGYSAAALVGKAEGVDIGTDALIAVENAVGGQGADTLIGDQDDNTLEGAGGNDTVDGGAGGDTLVMTGKRAEYAASGTETDFTIVDGVADRDGTDSAHNIEFVKFADVTIAAGDLLAAANSPPLAGDGAQSTQEDTSVTFDARTFASDPDNDPLSVIAASALHGSVVINSNGTITYSPNLHFNGADTVSYTVSDGRDGEATGSIAMTVAAVDDPAVIGGSRTGSVTEDATLQATGLLTVSDVDGTNEAKFQAGPVAGSFGSMTLTEAGAWTYTLDNANATVQALNAGQILTDTLAVRSVDGTTSSVVITINGANEAGNVITNGNAGGTVNGTAGDDVFATAGGADLIKAGRGNDTIDAGSGNDVVDAGDGNDKVTGGTGIDTVSAGKGNDTIYATAGDDCDLYLGGDGSDTYDLHQITSAVEVTLGVSVFGRIVNGVGIATGSQIGTDALASIENAIGGSGNDTLRGDNLANALSGGAGADTILGLGGNDRIEGGTGDDVLSGGAGSDTFFFKPGFGNDRIGDFDGNPAGGQDLIDITAFGIATANEFDMRVKIADAGADTLVTIDNDPAQTIRLSGIGNHNTITADDFRYL